MMANIKIKIKYRKKWVKKFFHCLCLRHRLSSHFSSSCLSLLSLSSSSSSYSSSSSSASLWSSSYIIIVIIIYFFLVTSCRPQHIHYRPTPSVLQSQSISKRPEEFFPPSSFVISVFLKLLGQLSTSFESEYQNWCRLLVFFSQSFFWTICKLSRGERETASSLLRPNNTFLKSFIFSGGADEIICTICDLDSSPSIHNADCCASPSWLDGYFLTNLLTFRFLFLSQPSS